jgi:Transposase, Mutator family
MRSTTRKDATAGTAATGRALRRCSPRSARSRSRYRGTPSRRSSRRSSRSASGASQGSTRSSCRSLRVGLTTGEIAAHFQEVYGARVSKDTVSRITEKVTGEMTEWLNRPLEKVYPVIFIDAMVVKVRDGQVANKPVYVVIGVTVDGERDILGLWAGDGGEGAKLWLSVFTEIKNRGVQDVCIAVCDGLKGLPEAIRRHAGERLPDRARRGRRSAICAEPVRRGPWRASGGSGRIPRGDRLSSAWGRPRGCVAGEHEGDPPPQPRHLATPVPREQRKHRRQATPEAGPDTTHRKGRPAQQPGPSAVAPLADPGIDNPTGGIHQLPEPLAHLAYVVGEPREQRDLSVRGLVGEQRLLVDIQVHEAREAGAYRRADPFLLGHPVGFVAGVPGP